MNKTYIAVAIGHLTEHKTESEAINHAVKLSDERGTDMLVCRIEGRVKAQGQRYDKREGYPDDYYLDDDDPVDDSYEDESEEQAEVLTLKDSTINNGDVMQFFEGEDGTEYVYKFTVKAKEQSK